MALDTNQIVEYLWSSLEGEKEPHVYFLVDAARDKTILDKVIAASEEKESLFRGEKAVELARVAPYIVKLQRDGALTRWFIDNGWGNSWGIFMASQENLVQTRIHCRDLLEVYDEEGQPLLFRYYDPRVLRVYLPTCTAQELKLFFGPVHHITLEDEDPSTLLRYQNLEGKLDTRKVQ